MEIEDEDSYLCREGSICIELEYCGDGYYNAGEVCDDGDLVDGLGCSSDCSYVNDGWYCPTTGMCEVFSHWKCEQVDVDDRSSTWCNDGNDV